MMFPSENPRHHMEISPPKEAFWSYEDLALFVGAVLPALVIAKLGEQAIHFSNEGLRQVAFQVLLYLLLTMVLYFLIASRYRRPFWRSLGWIFEFRGAWLCILLGPLLALGIGLLSATLRAPGDPSIKNLITDRTSTIAIVFFGSFAGPIFEEMVFRGFLQPLLARSLGAWLAILVTDIPFALLHGPGFGWAWQSVGLIGLAGLVLGFVRYRTGSTVASSLVHIGYNATFFVGFLMTRSI